MSWTTTTLCTAEDVRSRMADTGLAAATSSDAAQDEIIARKVAQAKEHIRIALLSRLQRALKPYDSYQPVDVLDRLDNPTMLKQTAVAYTIYAMMEEGEARLRFNWEAASEPITDMMARWDRERRQQLDMIWPLLEFDVDNNGTISTLDRAFTNTLSSVRVTV